MPKLWNAEYLENIRYTKAAIFILFLEIILNMQYRQQIMLCIVMQPYPSHSQELLSEGTCSVTPVRTMSVTLHNGKKQALLNLGEDCGAFYYKCGKSIVFRERRLIAECKQESAMEGVVLSEKPIPAGVLFQVKILKRRSIIVSERTGCLCALKTNNT